MSVAKRASEAATSLSRTSRPRAHLTPPHGWLSDPNGLVVVNGRFHVFYQAHPDHADWGPMHWGHASTVDLVNWSHHPVALSPDAEGMIFSGSVVDAARGDQSPQADRLVAVFTRHHLGTEVQCVAESNDGGLSWERPRRAPVLVSPTEAKDFRDPALVRWDDGHDSWWVMVLAVGSGVEFYRSSDLVEWEFTSRWEERSDGPVVETPSLVALMDDDGRARWVLTVGYMGGGPESHTAMKYIVGTFDGRAFNADDGAAFRPVDIGPDFYAAHYFSHSDRPLWMGWLGNWEWARRGRSHAWRGVMSLPREVGLTGTGDDVALWQSPAREVLEQMHDVDLGGGRGVIDLPVRRGLVVVGGALAPRASGTLHLANDRGETVDIRWSCLDEQLTVESSRWLDRDLGRRVGTSAVAVLPREKELTLTIAIDVCAVEVFAAGGTTVASLCASPGSHWIEARIDADSLTELRVRAVPEA